MSPRPNRALLSRIRALLERASDGEIYGGLFGGHPATMRHHIIITSRSEVARLLTDVDAELREVTR